MLDGHFECTLSTNECLELAQFEFWLTLLNMNEPRRSFILSFGIIVKCISSVFVFWLGQQQFFTIYLKGANTQVEPR